MISRSRFSATALALAGTLAFSAAGCATSGDIASIDQRLATMERQISELSERSTSTERRLSDVERQASAAVERAKQAEAASRAAAGDAADASERAQRMFDRSVKK